MADPIALVTPQRTYTLAELRGSTASGVLRATLEASTVAAIHGAMLGDVSLSLLHPHATAADEQALRSGLPDLDADTVTLLSTSGSTGRPKRVELSRRAWRAHAEASNAHLGLRSDDRWLVTLPLAHTGGLSIVMRCLGAGATVVLDDVPKLGPPFARWMSTMIGEHGVTRLSLVPAQLACLLDEDVRPGKVRSVLLGGQAAPPALVARALAASWPTVTSYGMTETCGMCVASKVSERVSGAVGHPLAGVSLRLVEGRLEIDSPARATRVHGGEPFTSDGWLRTEDRALLGKAGLVLLGRSDDVIVSSGHKVDPLEVEAELATLDGVAAVAVVGIAHEVHGQTVAALIVPRPGTDLDALRRPAPAGLAAYKQPRLVRLVDALPLLPSGKVDRAAVRGLLQ